jgi:hypothetical protein
MGALEKLLNGFDFIELDKTEQKQLSYLINNDWNSLLKDHLFSEEELRKIISHVNDIDWEIISSCQKLSEAFIEEFQDKIKFGTISKYQILSEVFIRKYKDVLDLKIVANHQKLTPEFIKEFELEKYIEEDNWLYNSFDLNKFYIKDTKYEITSDGEHIIAYKPVRIDNHSVFNFQHKYEVGETYTSHCDCTNEVDSFGLSAQMKDDNSRYYNERKLLKVLIHMSDIGRIGHGNNKIRCFKLKVLEEV